MWCLVHSPPSESSPRRQDGGLGEEAEEGEGEEEEGEGGEGVDGEGDQAQGVVQGGGRVWGRAGGLWDSMLMSTLF